MNNKNKLLIKEKHIELIMLYFKYRNVFNLGYHQYKIFKNLIIYITGITKKTDVRNIFETLLSRNIFQLKYRHNSRFYIFNPYNLEYIGYNNRIDFD